MVLSQGSFPPVVSPTPRPSSRLSSCPIRYGAHAPLFAARVCHTALHVLRTKDTENRARYGTWHAPIPCHFTGISGDYQERSGRTSWSRNGRSRVFGWCIGEGGKPCAGRGSRRPQHVGSSRTNLCHVSAYPLPPPLCNATLSTTYEYYPHAANQH